MNKRILKKLSKRAANMLGEKFRGMNRFVCERGDSIDSHVRVDRKHLERMGGTPNRHGFFAALKGTVGYGAMSGYYEPEWEEKDAYSLLRDMVIDHFTDWENCDDGEWPDLLVEVRTPAQVFRLAAVIELAA